MGMATDALKEQEEKNLKDLKTNLGQYTGATLEGGSARLDKFARLLGGKKKESKGLFGRKPVPAPNQQQAGHSNVVNGNDLNRKLEDQFYRAKDITIRTSVDFINDSSMIFVSVLTLS